MARRTEAEFWEIKMIGLGIFFGIFVVFFGPLVGWRCLVSHRRSSRLLALGKTTLELTGLTVLCSLL